jgi:hemoglobin
MGFGVNLSGRDAWLLCMKRALDQTPPDEKARLVILRALAPLADWMRNVEE